ncbi:MAG: antibiotic biosynthesis monooxygenase [Nocardioides sp.]
MSLTRHPLRFRRTTHERTGSVASCRNLVLFEPLRLTDEREQWLVITRWRDEESFQAWVRGART